jgi:hypothetical protein
MQRTAVMYSGGFEGVADVSPYGDTVAGKAASRSCTLYSAGAVATAPGVGLYTRGRLPCR